MTGASANRKYPTYWRRELRQRLKELELMLKLFVQEMYVVGGEKYVVEGYKGGNMWWRQRLLQCVYIIYNNMYMS